MVQQFPTIFQTYQHSTTIYILNCDFSTIFIIIHTDKIQSQQKLLVTKKIVFKIIYRKSLLLIDHSYLNFFFIILVEGNLIKLIHS